MGFQVKLLGFCVLLVSFLSLCYGNNVTVQVVGLMHCKDCVKPEFSSNHPNQGINVLIRCKSRNKELTTEGNGTIDRKGKFHVTLSTENEDTMKGCFAKLQSESSKPCPIQSPQTASINLITIQENVVQSEKYSPKPLRFSPVTCQSAFFWPYIKCHWPFIKCHPHPIIPFLPNLPPLPPAQNSFPPPAPASGSPYLPPPPEFESPSPPQQPSSPMPVVQAPQGPQQPAPVVESPSPQLPPSPVAESPNSPPSSTFNSPPATVAPQVPPTVAAHPPPPQIAYDPYHPPPHHKLEKPSPPSHRKPNPIPRPPPVPRLPPTPTVPRKYFNPPKPESQPPQSSYPSHS